MLTVIETIDFQNQASRIWTEIERHTFIDWIAENPLAGEVIPAAQGARKVRWAVAGRGKRGGVRIVYFNLSAAGVLVLFAIYAKNEQANILGKDIKKPT